MATKTSICSQALNRLSENGVADVDTDPSVRAELCRVNFDNVFETVLTDREWTFARRRTSITPAVDAPPWGYGNQFRVPPDSVRVLQVSDRPIRGDQISGLDWELEGEFILANTDKVYVRYLTKEVSFANLPSVFAKAVSLRLAHEICLPITKSKTLQDKLLAEYVGVLSDAYTTNAMQGKNRVVRSSRLTNARYAANGVGITGSTAD